MGAVRLAGLLNAANEICSRILKLDHSQASNELWPKEMWQGSDSRLEDARGFC